MPRLAILLLCCACGCSAINSVDDLKFDLEDDGGSDTDVDTDSDTDIDSDTDTDTDSDTDTDTDADTDTDTDTDSDSDTDTDTDSDSDTDTDTDSDTDTDTCAGQNYQQCGTDGDVHWYDFCNEEGPVAEDCPDQNAVCVDLTDTTAECQCEGNWDFATACTECLGNWSEVDNCESCMFHWIDNEDDCGTCPPNWDPVPNCNSCLNNWDVTDDCNSCLYGWHEPDCDDCHIFVNVNSISSAPDGLTWSDAYTTVQQGIDAARTAFEGAADPDYCQVWVAQGTYYIYDSDPTDTVQLEEFVNVYGGFDGTETALDQRDWVAHPTILDGYNGGLPQQVYHVVTGSDLATVDGFAIANGNAVGDSIDWEDTGAGLFAYWTSPAVRNCIFRDNHAVLGGGVATTDGSPSFENCIFHDNTAENYGGGAWTTDGAPSFTNCVFWGNSTIDIGGGGALYNYIDGFPVVTNSIAWNNVGGEFETTSSTFPITVTYSDVQGGFTGDGNIDVNPGFVAWNDFHLDSSSPCIDAGDGNAAPELDFDGNPRVDVVAVPNTGTGSPSYTDIGAYEYQP